MRNRGALFLGLLLLLCAATFPFWYNLAAGQTSRGLVLRLPTTERECVAPVAYMKTSHMKLLADWRDRAVRENHRTYEAYSGRTFTISLTGTCLKQCHAERAGFCDRCHAYNGVPDPGCWDCHTDPQALRREDAADRGRHPGE